MKLKSSCSKTTFVGRYRAVLKLARPVVMGGIALTLGLAAITAPPCAEATPICTASVLHPGVSVYLYNADGLPIAVADAYIDEGGVYTDTGFVGTIDVNDWIVDADNNIVGYVTYSGPN